MTIITYIRKNRLLPGIIFLFLWVISGQLNAQTDLVLTSEIIGRSEAIAPHSVSLKPGFKAPSGTYFHAYIGTAPAQPATVDVDVISNTMPSIKPTAGMNYIKTNTYFEPRARVTTGAIKRAQEILYVDGLGRPLQTVYIMASPLGKDIIQPIIYDCYGRESYKTLPYPEEKDQTNPNGLNTGYFRTGVTTSTVNNFYSAGTLVGVEADDKAYTEIGFDNSPLNRPVKQTGPGLAWASNPVTIAYKANAGDEPGWSVSGNAYSSFTYTAGSLYLTETTDENSHISREYKDRQGQVVLKMVYSGSEWLRTAYIYDDLGLLRCVVPPLATGPDDTQLCYYYTYNGYKQMESKQVPGGGKTLLVYDGVGRLACTQNALQGDASSNYWTFTKYDELDRPIMTGRMVYTGGVAALRALYQSAYNNGDYTSESYQSSEDNWAYTNNSFPNTKNLGTGGTILTVNYYDYYSFFSDLSIVGSYNRGDNYNKGIYNFSDITSSIPKGRLTSTVNVASANSDYSSHSSLRTTYYYNKYGDVLRTVSGNIRGTIDVVSNRYEDVTHKLLSTLQEQYSAYTKILSIEKTFEYDAMNRVLATRMKVNDQPEITISANVYNETGQVVTKYLHSTQTSGQRSFLQKIDYKYNIRGWLTKMNDPDNLTSENDLFAFQLCYANTSPMGSLSGVPQYNGNIAGIRWNTKYDALRGYSFTYDPLNRLKKASYADGSGMASNSGYFNEEITDYDKNGNIKGLTRKYQNALTDNLTYIYSPSSNQLLYIKDAGASVSGANDYPGNSGNYLYDLNGSMRYDGAKNVTLTNNPELNLPLEANFGNNNRITYCYSSAGAKLEKKVLTGSTVTSTTQYLGNIVYENNALSYITTDEGRLVPQTVSGTTTFQYEYFLRDHLGNTRATFSGTTNSSGALQVLQTDNYYPFGLAFGTSNYNSASYSRNKYLYNGKEVQDDVLGGVKLGWYDYGARFYDAQIGRFTTLDPLAEEDRRWTPYAYGLDNSIRHIDPDGCSGWDVVNGTLRGVTDNILGTDTRSGYEPTDPDDYNGALDNADRGSQVAGTGMAVGGTDAAVGGTVAAGTGVGAVVAVVAVGVAVEGTLMTANATRHLVEGNHYGENNKGTFNGKQDTESKTSREGLRNAKDQNGVPRSQQPDKTTTVREKETGKPLTQHEYTNSKGEKVQIRKDNPKKYGDGGKGDQGKHYNAGQAGKKLDQHHNYGE